jgi:CTP:molybdopterin cytidylyltransferase MocA
MIERRIGVILAAGRGRRMGQTKQLLAWQTSDGEKPLIAAAFDAIRPICDRMIVVLGHERISVAAALGDRTFHVAQSDPDAPMFASIRAGLLAARDLDPAAHVVLQPGDHPEVSPATLAMLADESRRQPSCAVMPAHQGRGGHPVLIPPNVVSRVLSSECPAGLGEFWTAHPEICVRVVFDDPAVVRDVDRPSDLRQ